MKRRRNIIVLVCLVGILLVFTMTCKARLEKSAPSKETKHLYIY